LFVTGKDTTTLELAQGNFKQKFNLVVTTGRKSIDTTCSI